MNDKLKHSMRIKHYLKFIQKFIREIFFQILKLTKILLVFGLEMSSCLLHNRGWWLGGGSGGERCGGGDGVGAGGGGEGGRAGGGGEAEVGLVACPAGFVASIVLLGRNDCEVTF